MGLCCIAVAANFDLVRCANSEESAVRGVPCIFICAQSAGTNTLRDAGLAISKDRSSQSVIPFTGEAPQRRQHICI
jgi:hypothetical protein